MSEKLRAKTALVLSTFFYLAYGNEHMFVENSAGRIELPAEFGSFEFHKDEAFYRQERRSDLGLSLYDVYRDGSGVMYSSAKRPILNMRADYVSEIGHRPRELSADMIMIGFLESEGIAYDVFTDHDLHANGSILKQYDTAITCSHPEYPTMQSYNAYRNFVNVKAI